MTGEHKPPIIVKRIKKSGGGHHGGAWKIAYADFVTAMMAFFLLMWLLGSTTKGDLQGIAEYFRTPLKVALAGGSGSGDSSSVIQGGGTDLTRSNGQVQKTDNPAEKKTINLKAAQAELARQEMERLKDLKTRIDTAIDANVVLRPYKNQLKVEITADGLRVQIVDEQNRPMFDSGSATLAEYSRGILREIGKLLNDVPNRISLSGHTDANPYAGGERGYSNWELSADRANASRRELILGGIEEKKIIRVVGLGAAVMLDKSDAVNPINRRISITVLNHKSETRILDDSLEPADPDALPEAASEMNATGGSTAAGAAPVPATGAAPSATGVPGAVAPAVAQGIPAPTAQSTAPIAAPAEAAAPHAAAPAAVK
jgi:chemotaxis protein MotB